MIQASQVDEKQIMTAASKFQKVFRESDLNALGKKLGLCVRERTITPFRLALSVVTSLACNVVESLADLQRDSSTPSRKPTLATRHFTTSWPRRSFPR